MNQEIILNNPLKNGMIFKNSGEACRFIGYKDTSHSNQNLSRLSHYCTYHRDDKYVVYIDNVFDEIIPFRDFTFKYSIGDIINTKTGKLKVIDRYYTFSEKENKNRKTYKFECMIDGYVFELFENRIKDGVGCPLCGGRKLVPGIRSLFDERPEILIYLKNPEDAKNVTSSSSKKITCKCPFCKTEKEIIVSNLVRYGFTCSYCSEGISYPNKFIRNVLYQLNVGYFPEKSFEWSQGKIYDEYIPNKSIIIENHGSQHYQECTYYERSLEEEQSNDEFKKKLALENNIENYIVLDCRHSTKEWIKNSIMKSDLPQLIGFSEKDINWDECDNFCHNNELIKQISHAWKKNHNLTILSQNFKLGMGTVRKYLVIGVQCGYCDFEVDNIEKNGKRQATSDVRSKPIYYVEGNLYFRSKYELQHYFNSIGIKVCGKNLYNFITKNKKYKGMTFTYISKVHFNKMKQKAEKENLSNVYGEAYNPRYIKEDEYEKE